ncbi:MAG TPA: hypothetical protein DCZ52_01035 [Lachnospiraceae bacterium]|nr:hypothetical protein [Lachnospiraceae bacterium]
MHKGIRTAATAKPVRMIQWIILKQRGLKGGGAAGGNPSSRLFLKISDISRVHEFPLMITE